MRNALKAICVAVVLCLPTAIAAPAQTFTTLVNFSDTNGAIPVASLVQGTDGELYGTTANGGGNGYGEVFKVTPAGTLTPIYGFCSKAGCADGASPYAGVVLGSDENFYGTTFAGGTGSSCTLGCGTVFKITRSGVLTTLHSFNLTDGAYPSASLIQATDGNFYGTTWEGGSGSCGGGCGTIFKITPAGTFTLLHSFDFIDGDGLTAALIQGVDGNLYGTAGGGGFDRSSYCAFGCGTVFKITEGGALTTLHEFEYTDGTNPAAPLIQASNGNFYGTTYEGGANGAGVIFKITPLGVFSTLYTFDWSDGAGSAGALLQAADGNLYGTTAGGGDNGVGTVFKIRSGGKLTTIHAFGNDDGDFASAGFVQATTGLLYGTTSGDGVTSDGTVFSESVGLSPFVTLLPTSRAIGQRVAILGNNLTGTTSVTFNGTPATFTVVSSTEISATVPSGATTGPVQVVTPSGTLTSNVPFKVVP